MSPTDINVPSHNPKTIVTGGYGMLGSNLVKRLVATGHHVIVIDNNARGMREHARALWDTADGDGEITIIELDVRALANDPQAHEILSGATSFIHLADIVAGIGYVFGNQFKILHENIEIDRAAYELCAAVGAQQLIYASTACAFNQEKQRSLDAMISIRSDLYPANPESTYGWAKVIGDISLENLAPSTRMKKTTIFFHNLIGSPCDFWSEKSQMLPAISKRAIEAMSDDVPALSIWGSGQQGRALVPVSRAVDAIVHALHTPSRYYHVGPNFCTSVAEVAELVTTSLDGHHDITFDTTKPEGDIGRSVDPNEEYVIPGFQITKEEVKLEIASTVQWISKEIAKE